MNLTLPLTIPLLVWLLPQGQEPAGEPAAPAKCAIEGRVVHASTGAPLKKATLLLFKAEGREQPAVVRSDSQGRFVFRDVEPGRYYLSASRTGFAHQQYGSRGRKQGGTVLTLEAGQELTGLVLRLQPQGVITGLVLDGDGEPVMNAEVQALRYEYDRRKRELRVVGQAMTNDLGEFRLYGLRPGQYYVSANSSPYELRWGARMRSMPGAGQEQGYAATYYPGTVDPAAASPVEVAPGAEARIQIALQRVPTLRIRGRVVNPFATGRDRETFVALIERSPARWVVSYRSSPVLDDQGNFEIRGIVPGRYTLNAEWHRGEERRSGRKNLEVTENLDDVVVEITAGFELTGVLRVEGMTELNYADLRITLEPRDEDWIAGKSTTVKDDGSFTFRNVAPDHYRLAVHGAPESCYLRSVRLGGREVRESGFELDGPTSQPMEVYLNAEGGRIEGEVLDERKKPVRGAQVALVPGPPRREQSFLFKSTATDQFGRFSLAGIAPGDYKLFAWDGVDEGAWEDPDFLKPFEELGKPVQVVPNSKLSATLTLLASGEPAPKAPAPRSAKPRAKGALR